MKQNGGIRALLLRGHDTVLRNLRWLLPVTTALVICAALVFPQVMLYRWEQREMNVVHQEGLDIARVMTSNVLSGSDRLYLFRRSGISARDGKIVYREGVPTPIERHVIDMSSAAISYGGGFDDDVSYGFPFDAHSGKGHESEENVAAAQGKSAVTDSGAYEKGTKKNGTIPDKVYDMLLYLGETVPFEWKLQQDSIGGAAARRVNEYLSYVWDILASYSVFDKRGFGALLIYSHDMEDIQAEYCVVTDDNPYFSMSLLCITCTMEKEKYGLAADSSVSIVADEETGMIYAMSMAGAPGDVLTDVPLDFLFLVDILGVSCTEAGIDAETYPPSAYFNFGGYLYRLEQSEPRPDYAVFNFNMESNLQ